LNDTNSQSDAASPPPTGARPDARQLTDFKVELSVYRGPLDLLLYLVRRNEVQADELSVSKITKQYEEFLEILEAIDIDLVGDFLELAGLLLELKLRAVLPRNELLDDHDTQLDPREDLVQRLLSFKEFRDAAELLNEQGRLWQERFTRVRNDLPPRKIDPSEQPIHEVELWDLVSAFGRMLKRQQRQPQTDIVFDDTPITVYMQRIHQRVVRVGQASFSALFEPGMHKSAMVGVFLAILELSRHHYLVAEQADDYGEIMLRPAEGFQNELQLDDEISFSD